MADKLQKTNSYTQLNNRLSLTLAHFNIVHTALSGIAALKGPDRALSQHAIFRNEELTIQLLYTHLNEYLQSIVLEMYEKKPLEIVNKAESSLSFRQIVSFGTYEAICNHMVEHVFRALLDKNRSTSSLVKEILKKTSVDINQATLDQANYYMEIRHLVVHNSSRVDRKFVTAYGSKFSGIKVGSRVPVSLGLTKKAIIAIRSLCQEIDEGLIQKGYINSISLSKAAIPVSST